jgi:hypothetical protein
MLYIFRNKCAAKDFQQLPAKQDQNEDLHQWIESTFFPQIVKKMVMVGVCMLHVTRRPAHNSPQLDT